MKGQQKARNRIGRFTHAAALAATLCAPAFADDKRDSPDKGCNAATIRGDYGIQIQGTRSLAGGGTESVIGVVLRTYDGHGNLDQTDNVKGSVTGLPVQDRPGYGTYEVNADCTGIARFDPAPGIHLEERIIIVNNGNETRSITSTPAGVNVSGIGLRIRQR